MFLASLSRLARVVALGSVVLFPVAASAAEPERTDPVPSGAPLVLDIDASQAPLKIYHVKATLPAKSGPFTFVYPKWIPGYHGPVGPINDVVSLKVRAGGAPLEWRRDLEDFYAVHTTVPSGATSVEVDFDLVGAQATTGEMESPSTANLLVLAWSSLLMYPQGMPSDALPVKTTLTLPHGWNFGTALEVASRAGDTVTFAPVSLTTLIDSPLNAGRYFREVDLGAGKTLDIAGDTPESIEISAAQVTGMKHLVAEGPAAYASEHYSSYHFLLTLSDAIGANGIEHHQSSDNRAPEKYLSDASVFRTFSDLMPHEYSHSWNGKYRRPADLYVDDFQKPERTDLLWVYEGLNQFMGELLDTRARLVSFEDQLQTLAINAASMDVESGRTWRSLRDTADEAPLLYESPPNYTQLRRTGGDFYTEDDLVWLEADVTIRRVTGGAKSLDDFLHAWAAPGGRSIPSVKTYERDDVVATLASVAPFDWAGFFKDRIDRATPHAPLGGITGGGYRLDYTDTPTDYFKTVETNNKADDFRYSLGMIVSSDDKDGGTVKDVLVPSPAFAAGIAPGFKIVAVNGRRYSADALHAALKNAKATREPLQIIVANGDSFTVTSIPWFEGDRFPRLVRDTSKPDVLKAIYAPKTFAPLPESNDKKT
jgi:predicted metalloprotease with PDZ domain